MKTISLKTFLYHFCNDQCNEQKYCFILGAGASKTSGIDTGAELAQKWYNEISKMQEEGDFNAWGKKKVLKKMI